MNLEMYGVWVGAEFKQESLDERFSEGGSIMDKAENYRRPTRGLMYLKLTPNT